MKLRVSTPSRAYIESATHDEMEALRKDLTYANSAANHLVKRHFNNKWYKAKNPDAWALQLEELKANVHHTLVYDDAGRKYIRPGSIPYLEGYQLEVINEISYPTPRAVPWAKPLPFDLHPYQEQSWKNLLEVKHGNVELTTAAGKSAIIMKYCRETGFRTAIVAPGKVVFNELLEKFEHHFGKNMVGTFGDGKKKIGKRFTICISDSLSNIKPGTEEWEFFSSMDAICTDESHTWGAETLEDLCHGIFRNVPYRNFFSATQTRGDGAEKLLHSIIGKTVAVLTTAEAVQKKYIADHEFRIIQLESSNPNVQSGDALEMKRIHFLGNRNIAAFIAKLANVMGSQRKQTLVLVEELNQISMLMKLLTVPAVYAHSETKKDRLIELGLDKVNVAESVEAFNRGDAMVLIGTSCIATGTNIFPTHQTANWVGGQSEIKTKQGAVGRSVRHWFYNPHKANTVPKEKSIIFDFDVWDIPLMGKHLAERIAFYEDSGTTITRVKLK